MFRSRIFLREWFPDLRSDRNIGTPDILIVDEVLSVGDFHFRKNVRARIQNTGSWDNDPFCTPIVLSRSRKICNKMAWLVKGH